MSKKITKKNQWGGPRKGAGRPEGRTREKICVSVNKENWQAALNGWQDTRSRLVDWLVMRYVQSGGAAPEIRTAL